MSRTLTFTVLVPNTISMMSPTFTLTEALAGLPFTMTRPASQASLATVRRLIRRDTFRNLSSLIFVCLSFLAVFYFFEEEGRRFTPQCTLESKALSLAGFRPITAFQKNLACEQADSFEKAVALLNFYTKKADSRVNGIRFVIG